MALWQKFKGDRLVHKIAKPEFNAYSIEHIHTGQSTLFVRTGDLSLMEAIGAKHTRSRPSDYQAMNNLTKVVFSKTLRVSGSRTPCEGPAEKWNSGVFGGFMVSWQQ
jgi:hypothetical protein